MEDPLVRGDVYLRSVERDDLGRLKNWRNSWDIRMSTREYRLITFEDQERWFDSLSRRPPTDVMFVICNQNALSIGCCGLTHIDWKNRNAEISIYIGDPKARGSGIGKAALAILEDYGFGELGLWKLWAEVYSFNVASHELFVRSEYHYDGRIRDQVFRDGKGWASDFYSKTRAEWDKFKEGPK